jgi:hypothetical protein
MLTVQQISELDLNLYKPTIARKVPTKIKRMDSFSATNIKEARLHQAEHPNVLPTS